MGIENCTEVEGAFPRIIPKSISTTDGVLQSPVIKLMVPLLIPVPGWALKLYRSLPEQ